MAAGLSVMLGRLKGLLLGPHPRVRGRQLRRQSELLSTFVLILPFVMGVMDGYRYWNVPSYRVPWYGYVLMLVAYGANRAGFYQPASLLITAMFPATVVANILRASSPLPLLSLAFLPLGLVVAAILITRRGMVVVALLNSAALVLVTIVAPTSVPFPSVFVPYLVLNWVVAMLALVLLHMRELAARDQLEDRQAFDAVFDQTAHLIGLLTPQGRVVAFNAAALRLVGKTAEQVVGGFFPNWAWCANADRDQLTASMEAAAAGRPSAFQTTYQNPEGPLLHIDFTISPFRDKSGKIVYLIPEGRDVSELVKTQQNLHHAQRMEAVGQLAGGIAHDFNNMLGAILGSAELLEDGNLGEAKRRNYVQSIITAAERAGELVRKLLDLSRRSMNTKSPLHIRSLVDACVEVLSRTVDKRIILSHTLQLDNARDPALMADAAQLQNVFLNLGINASQAMPEGGRLSFVGSLTDLDAARCAGSPFRLTPGRYVHYAVEDTGIGMAPDVQGRVFEPFFTTKPVGAGTGLGLSTAYATITDHRGAISVHSEVGRGTTFHIFLPLCSLEPPLEARERTKKGPGGKILVVDDEPLIRQTAAAILKKLGYEIELADGGNAALRCYLERQPDLVLLDMVMPDMNGNECFRLLRASDPTARVVLTSGFVTDRDLTDLFAAGLLGFLAKPYTTQELVEAIAAALNAPA